MWQWIQSLSILGATYFWVGVAASGALILQIILMLFSLGGGADADVDSDADVVPDNPDSDVGSGVSLFTIKGLTAFFTLGAWVGLLCVELFPENLEALSILPAFLCGTLGMVAFAFAMKGMLKLQSSGNLEKKNVVGQTATVYVSIQPRRTGRGKITLTAQGQFMELDAVTDETEKLCVDEKVIVMEFSNGTAMVKRI